MVRVIAASARIVAAVSSTAQPHSVCSGELCCTTTVDNSGVYVCYLKGFVSVYFRCPSRTVRFSGTHLYLCVSTTNQAERHSSAVHLLARWEQSTWNKTYVDIY